MKNTNKLTREITKYLKMRGLEIVLQECGNNLRVFRAHIKRVCNLPKGTKLYYIIQMAKEVLKNRLNAYGDAVQAVEKFLEVNFGEINNG